MHKHVVYDDDDDDDDDIIVWHFGFKTSRFRNFSIFLDGIGIGFEKFWYRKKYRYRFRKILVSEKVSVSVSEKIGIGKKFRIRFRTNFRFRHTLYCVQRAPSSELAR